MYAHISDVVLIDMSAAIADFSKSGDGNIDSLACKLLQCKSTVMSVKICETTDSPVVVVGCMESVQIWSCRDGERLTNYTLPNPPIEDDFLTYDRRYYARGAAMVISHTHAHTHTHHHPRNISQHLCTWWLVSSLTSVIFNLFFRCPTYKTTTVQEIAQQVLSLHALLVQKYKC